MGTPQTTTVRTPAVDVARTRLRQNVTDPTPPPDDSWLARVAWGFAQPLLGLRTVVREPELRRASIIPVLGLAALCTLAAWGESSRPEGKSFFVAWYATLLALAPIPSLLFARHYARVAARAHRVLGLGAVEPFYKRTVRTLWETLVMVIAIAVGLAPVVWLVGTLPGVGRVLALVLGAGWTLNWIVIEAFDSARTLAPGDTTEAADARAMRLPQPWFVRIYIFDAPVPGLIRGLGRALAGPIGRLVREWRAELLLVERAPAVSIGFGAATAVLLAVPGLNLMFRPAVVAGATHVRARFEGGFHETGEAAPAMESAQPNPN
jgi:uncharacterized protein involved in cysteine biosynthesis